MEIRFWAWDPSDGPAEAEVEHWRNVGAPFALAEQGAVDTYGPSTTVIVTVDDDTYRVYLTPIGEALAATL